MSGRSPSSRDASRARLPQSQTDSRHPPGTARRSPARSSARSRRPRPGRAAAPGSLRGGHAPPRGDPAAARPRRTSSSAAPAGPSPSGGTSAMLSSRSAWLSASRPWAASARARASRSADPRSGAAVGGHQPQRGAEPAGGAGRGTQDRCGAGLAEHRHGRHVPGRAECSTWWARAVAGAPRGRAAAAQRSWAPSRQPPGALSYTARRTSGWRKRKRRGTSVACTRPSVEQLVERRHQRASPATPAGRRRELGLERVPGDRRAPQHRRACRRRAARAPPPARRSRPAGTPTSDERHPWRAPGARRQRRAGRARAAGGRTGCRPPPRRARPPARA